MRNGVGTLVAPLCLLLTLSACAKDEEAEAPPPEPVVIESPHTDVRVGTGTVEVYGPTMFAYLGVSEDGGRPSAALLAAAQDFQMGVQGAQTPLRGLGVRIEAISEPPTLLDTALESRAGPPLTPGSYGYLFVDAVGHVRRLSALRSAAELVCLTAEVFGLTLDAQQSASCR